MLISTWKKLVFNSTCLLAVTAVSIGCGKKADDIAIESPSYFGAGANEAAFSLEATLISPKSAGTPTEDSVHTSVKTIMKYILGSIHDEGAVYAGFQSKIKSVEPSADGSNKVTYTLTGKGVFKKDLKEIQFNIPMITDKLWALSKEKCHNPSDEVDDGNFWYAWTPERARCPLVKDTHWMKVIVPLIVMPATSDTYPEYERLVIDNQLTTTMFFGAADHDNKNWNPLDPNHKDDGVASYMQARDYLVKTLGFSARAISADEIRANYGLNSKLQIPFLEELTKQTSKGIFKIKLFFLETQYTNDGSTAFHFILKNAIKNDAVILYDGHSGIGRNLNLDRIEIRNGFKISFNTNYQLIYFGSCLPYAYYTDLFFKRKVTADDPNGTKNLDILSYAKESHFGNVENLRVVLALDDYMSKGVRTSYQKIITENPRDFFGVIGDEDNGTQTPVTEKPQDVQLNN